MTIGRKATLQSYESELDGHVSRNVTRQASKVSSADRARVLKQHPLTVWLTGLPGSGKSTIAQALERALIDAGHACRAPLPNHAGVETFAAGHIQHAQFMEITDQLH